MTAAEDLIESVQAELAPRDDENRLVPLVASGEAPREVFERLAAEEYHIVRSDWRSCLTLAARAEQPEVRDWFAGLAAGEQLALGKLPALAAEEERYEPQAGCQAYPSYFAWLALNAEPAEVVVGLYANFAAWGRYCASLAGAMRRHYGYDDEACAFLDFFATPPPDGHAQAVAAVQAGLDAGVVTRKVRRYARLVQSYELMFWNNLI